MKISLLRTLLFTSLLGVTAAGSLNAMNDDKEAKAAQINAIPNEQTVSDALFYSAQAGNWDAIPAIKRLLNNHSISYQEKVDASGNNALHFAAAVDNIAMYNLIRSICPGLTSHANNNHHYPIELLSTLKKRLLCIPGAQKILLLCLGLILFWLNKTLEYLRTPNSEGFIETNKNLGIATYVALLPLVYLLYELHLYHDPAPVTRPL